MVLVPMLGVESIAVGVYVGTGSRFETPKINGLSHFLEHMVFKGTHKFPTHQETSYLEGLGAMQNAWTDVDTTCYYCKIPANYWRQALELMKELAINPTFPAKDLEIERGVILEEISRKEDRPDELSGEVLQKLMYRGNPLGMTILGDATVIKQVAREDFVAYHEEQYVARNIVVAMAGKIDVAEAKKAVEEWFSVQTDREPKALEPVADVQKKSRVEVLRRKLANQAHIEIGLTGLTVSDPRRYALTLLTSYLGYGLSSRLFTELREKRGLCYAVRASEERWVDTGVWSVYAGLNIEKLEEAVGAVLGEMKRLKEVKLSEKELIAAKEKVRGPLVFSMENPLNQMDFYAKQALDRPEEILTYDEVVGRLMQTDSTAIQKVAEDLFRSDKLNLAVVGPIDAQRGKVLLEKLEI